MQNEIDAANTVKWDYLNAQGQPKISEIRSSISSAERSSGAARNATLTKLVTDVEASRSCDPKKTDLLKKALQDLQTLAM